jgi:hypothetical protein
MTWYVADKNMNTNYFRHYTSLSSLIHVLTYKKLTLSDPTNWEDRNDALYLEIYGNKRGYKSIYAICFTTTNETSHHWRIYAPGKHGVCIQIHANMLLKNLNNKIRHGLVNYKYLEEIEKTGVHIEDMPFLKRKPFGDEKEYRLIYQDRNKSRKPCFELPIKIEWINNIYLSHSMPKVMVKSVCDLLHSIKDCSKINITRTSLNENTRWKVAGLSAK